MSAETPPGLATDVAVMKTQLENLSQDIAQLKQSVSELARPRSTNWLAILGICFMALTPSATVLTFYVQSEVRPLKQQSEFDQRERTWLYDSVDKHMAWQDKNEERLFQKVFGNSPDPFVPPPRKN